MHVRSPHVDAACALGSTLGPCSAHGSFAEHGPAQLQTFIQKCFGRMTDGAHHDLITYIMQVGLISLATMCSGTDSRALVYTAILQVVHAAAQKAGVVGDVKVDRVFRHVFSCELNKKKRVFLQRMFAGDDPTSMQFLFENVIDVADEDWLVDHISGRVVQNPDVAGISDLAVGFPCQDVSKLNLKRLENLTVVRDGKKRTGAVFQGVVRTPLRTDPLKWGVPGPG